MNVIDDVLAANRHFAEHFSGNDLPTKPAKKLAVVACMDYRIPIAEALGLENGDAVVIRNAGGIITEDTLRSLLVAHYRLGVTDVMIINHTQCGMMTFGDEELVEYLEKETGQTAVIPAHFHTFSDLEANVRRQFRRLESHVWIPKDLRVRGFIYDVKTGQLTEVSPEKPAE
jgi:carbonic anhydrase